MSESGGSDPAMAQRTNNKASILSSLGSDNPEYSWDPHKHQEHFMSNTAVLLYVVKSTHIS